MDRIEDFAAKLIVLMADITAAIQDFPPVPASRWTEESVLKSNDGVPLATFYVGSRQALAVASRRFSADMPSLKWFFGNVLEKMRRKDEGMPKTGENAAFDYKVKYEGDIMREIGFSNVSPERVKEIKTSLRWALEKIYEKTR